VFVSGGGDRFSETPALSGLLTWTGDPALAQINLTPVAAIIHLTKVYIPNSITATNLHCHVRTAGNNYTNAQLGIYNSAGTFLKATAVQSSAGTNGFGSTGFRTIALTATQALTGGTFVWVAVHAGTNGATAFVLSATNIGTAQNVGLTAANYRSAHQTGSAASDLATIGNLTPASNNNTTNNTPWFAIS